MRGISTRSTITPADLGDVPGGAPEAALAHERQRRVLAAALLPAAQPRGHGVRRPAHHGQVGSTLHTSDNMLIC